MSSPIPKRWQEILAIRSSFTGTNEAFCKHHQVSISSFYKYKSMQQAQSSEAPPQFVRVEQQTQRTQINVTEQSYVSFNIRTGQLALPTTLCPNVVVTIIKGLSA
ncbi:IS66 family insertion sequence element accessory protein TnpA [Pseudoalteromonas sp. PA2MD11]|uniref:IS66 family insertion sequence element accessory protein TnpA n=1 Tax=Pseudoalteromonas sp. PA2MD11 TaxID=2785057 RepID=UPI001ADEF931|nr:IS66 family insertion sequence element accessory protein TnpB [Pseudoalteromonas sp. PA2MD11]